MYTTYQIEPGFRNKSDSIGRFFDAHFDMLLLLIPCVLYDTAPPPWGVI